VVPTQYRLQVRFRRVRWPPIQPSFGWSTSQSHAAARPSPTFRRWRRRRQSVRRELRYYFPPDTWCGQSARNVPLPGLLKLDVRSKHHLCRCRWNRRNRFCRRQTDTVGMAPLAHAEGYLGPPEGYPTGGHSLPLAPRGEVGDRQKFNEWAPGELQKIRVGPPGWRFRQYRRPLPTTLRITCSRGRRDSTAMCLRGFYGTMRQGCEHPLCQWGRRSGEHDDDPCQPLPVTQSWLRPTRFNERQPAWFYKGWKQTARWPTQYLIPPNGPATLGRPLVRPPAAGCHVPVDRRQRMGESVALAGGSP